MLCVDLEEWEKVEGRLKWERNICILTANSHCCIAGTNTLKANIFQLKINLPKQDIRQETSDGVRF